MYEINPSGGLISQTAKKNYQPKPVNFNLADTTGKPEPGHINVDKIRQQQLDMQKDQLALQYQQYALSVHNAENQPSGGKLICTEFWRMGIMADVIYEADQRFAVLLWDEEPELMRWYLGFAPWFVKHMQGRGLLDRWFTKLV